LAPGEPHPKAWQVTKALGLRGIYKGTGATLLRDVPFSMVFFPAHACFKSWMADGHQPSFPAVFGSGIMAGMLAAGIVTPMDVVKTRLQVQHKSHHTHYKGIVDAFRTIWKEEGPGALMKGSIPRMLIVSVSKPTTHSEECITACFPTFFFSPCLVSPYWSMKLNNDTF